MKWAETGLEMTEKEIIKEALDHLAEVCCLAFELESDEGHAFAWMVDSAIKYAQVIYRDDNVLRAACDYTAYEEEVCERHQEEKNLEVVK